MKRFIVATAITAVSAITMPVLAAEVTFNIGHPSYYGRLEVDGYPEPQVLESQTITIERVPVERPPVYLRVPQEQASNWKEYCGKYNACNERVLFVKDDWYNTEYVTTYKKRQHKSD